MTKTEKRKLSIDLLAILLGGLLPERLCQIYGLKLVADAKEI